MKNKLGWVLTTLAIMTFTLGASATVNQFAPEAAAAVSTAAGMPGAAVAAVPAAFAATDEKKVPHYFGPFSNWANSPQVLSNAIVTLTAPGAGGTLAEATATVDPKLGGISGITVTSPGSNYLFNPTVAITSPGSTTASGATATAAISSGVITSFAVGEAGFGFTTPDVVLTGGGSVSAQAVAQASGGVDDLTITHGGSGYKIKPLVVFTSPDAAFCTVPLTTPVTPSPCAIATGTATMTGGVVNGVAVVNPGSGYTTAPTVTVLDGDVTGSPAPVPAIVAATIGISQIDVTSGGAGYDSAPIVTINDSIAPLDKGASATAAVAARGAVTAITVTNAGTGYLTPGLKKFVDTLAGGDKDKLNTLNQFIPTAVPDTTTYPGSDYYEIAVVQYRQKFHTSLPASLLRGYVQLETSVPDVLTKSSHAKLTNANLKLDPAVADAPVLLKGAQVYGVEAPHYLGPTIVASKNRPVRVLFRNLLPKGVDGDLFLPVDTSLMGSGAGPDSMELNPTTKVPVDMVKDDKVVTDEVRNPACAEAPKLIDAATGKGTCFSQNRATLHMHGGITPWISDGTPHQWVTPDGENTAYPKGVSVKPVPDMPDPGPGAQTFFYTNQQSARLMWTHDHSWGITRLNVYAGEAAGYLLTDATEAKLIGAGGALETVGIGDPLIIQDKTFVSKDIALSDPTWDEAKWGGEGSLWTPHVYMPAQNPGDPSGMSSFGRWMYGPWFWPPAKDVKYAPVPNPYYNMNPADNFKTALATPCDVDVPATWQYKTEPFCEPALVPGTPNVSVGMEAFNDTPIVNGTAYPKTSVDPKAYRYRILNAANDRSWNLSWYVADPTTGTLSEVALNKAEVLAAQTDPVVFPTPDTALSPAGPNWIQVGNESGFLPTPVVAPAHPTTWITDPTRFDVGNVDLHSLALAPAERADVVVDFSAYKGKTLILYNDAPAAWPARVPGYDYYTGGPDMSPAGAPTTLPGYGPNTRTIMQVTVSGAKADLAFDRPNTTIDRMGALEAAFIHHTDAAGKPAGVFESGSEPIIVGQAAYNKALGTNFAANGWCNSPTNPAAKCDGFARIAEQGGDTFKFDTLGPLKDGNGPKVGVKIEPKGIHDEMNSASFDEFGRMTANMGLEAPGATPLLQNIILYPYVNPATEILDATNGLSALDVTPISTAADGTQIWKITHNGVDTHPVHFHLNSVQLINRVTWDNIIIPPEPNEIGWKETVRVSPLEDTIVAMRPIVPTLPFGVPDSIRPLNPMMPVGAKGSINGLGLEAGFNNTDANGNPLPPIENKVVNMDWEYVWHCHILSHEEMDMMRPISVKVDKALPDAPVLNNDAGPAVLDWTDGTPVVSTVATTTSASYLTPASWTLTGNRRGTAEVGYRIQRAPLLANNVTGIYEDYGTAGAVANKTTFTDLAGLPGGYGYRVVAWNAAGESPSNAILVPSPLAAPTNVVGASGPALGQVALTWTATPSSVDSPVTGYVIERSPSTGPVTWTNVATVGVVTSYTVATGLTPGSSYIFRVQAKNKNGFGPWSTASAPARATTVPGAPTNLTTGTVTTTSIALNWAPPLDSGGVPITRYVVRRSTDNGLTWLVFGVPPVTTPAGTTWTWTGLTPGTTYQFQVVAQNSAGWGVYSSATPIVSTTSVAVPSAPRSVVGTPGNAKVALTWMAPISTGGSPITGYGVDYLAVGGSTWTTAIAPSAALTAQSYTVTGLTNGTRYVFRVDAANSAGSGPWSATSAAYTPAATTPAAPTWLATGPVTRTSITLNWAPPLDNGGATITRYVVRRSTDNGLTWLVFGVPPVTTPAGTTWTWAGLTPGTAYRFQVVAQNSAGWGIYSAATPIVSTLP